MLKVLSLRCALVIAGAVITCLTPAQAGYVVSNDTSFSYTGTVTGPTGTATTIPSFDFNGVTYTGRDLSLYATSGAPTAVTGPGNDNATEFLTAWYATLTPGSDPSNPQYGWGNPNNTDTGFFQLYDTSNTTITSAIGHWDSTLTKFTLDITGQDATAAATYARLWDAPNIGGAASDTKGEFETFNLSLVATFADPATEEFAGWYSTTAAPIAINGSMTGTFLNQSPNTALNGVYTYDLTLQAQNWASDVGAFGTGTSYFGGAIPEPATWMMLFLGFGILGLALRGRREGVAVAA